MAMMPYSLANKEAMNMYEDLVNKRYKEPQDGKFEDATKEIIEAVSCDSDADYDEDEEMEPKAAIPASSYNNLMILMTLMIIIHVFFKGTVSLDNQPDS